MPQVLATRCEDDERAATDASRSSMGKKVRMDKALDGSGNHRERHEDREMAEDAPMSPRVRKRLDDAKESASLFNPGECDAASSCGGACRRCYKLTTRSTA